ncbi:unnamed protein product [Parascedosporium putredinis]|uniref:Carboxymuconolactone decarboxylase-like domain-containing protein n=1 Tax=Parascedosporium putredinis TaxID=1442378 RepID=A0A9P1H5P4_9PEZI|nr:unnamed protein product [Parascedosporium putredinis]CAI7996713.1 unnamed protein product [Parascedosporium putredinis]
MAQQPSQNLLTGAKMVQEFFGDEILEGIRAQSRDDLPAKVSAEYIAEVCFSAYARPGLVFRERSLMNIAMLIALGRGPELRLHIRAALYNGLTEEQICEACRHAMIYCGVPAGRDALLVASDVFDEVKKSKTKDSKLA